MSLREIYREDVEQLERSLERNLSKNRFHYFEKILDAALPFVFLLLFFTVVFSFFLPLGSVHRVWIDRLNWALIAYFFTRLVVGYRLSRNRRKFFHDHWLDILLVIPVFAVLRSAKLARVAPFLRNIKFLEGAGAAGEAAKMTRITRIIKRSL